MPLCRMVRSSPIAPQPTHQPRLTTFTLHRGCHIHSSLGGSGVHRCHIAQQIFLKEQILLSNNSSHKSDRISHPCPTFFILLSIAITTYESKFNLIAPSANTPLHQQNAIISYRKEIPYKDKQFNIATKQMPPIKIYNHTVKTVPIARY